MKMAVCFLLVLSSSNFVLAATPQEDAKYALQLLNEVNISKLEIKDQSKIQEARNKIEIIARGQNTCSIVGDIFSYRIAVHTPNGTYQSEGMECVPALKLLTDKLNSGECSNVVPTGKCGL